MNSQITQYLRPLSTRHVQPGWFEWLFGRRDDSARNCDELEKMYTQLNAQYEDVLTDMQNTKDALDCAKATLEGLKSQPQDDTRDTAITTVLCEIDCFESAIKSCASILSNISKTRLQINTILLKQYADNHGEFIARVESTVDKCIYQPSRGSP